MNDLNSFPEKFNVLIQGASRGIGLEFVRQLAGLARVGQVVATCRDPSAADQLKRLADRNPDRIRAETLDITRPEQIESLAEKLESQGLSFSLVLNVAGLLHANDLQPEKRLEDIEWDKLQRVFAVNALGPALFVRHMHRLLARRDKAVLAAISARVGSIGDNRLGGWYAYRASKSALNQLLRTSAIELKRRRRNVIVAALHPGTTDTGLSAPFLSNVPEDKLFSVERTVAQLLKVIDGLDAEDSGGFFAWDGKPIEW